MLPKNFKSIHSIEIRKNAAKTPGGETVDLIEINYRTRMGNRGVALGIESDTEIKALRAFNDSQPPHARKIERIA